MHPIILDHPITKWTVIGVGLWVLLTALYILVLYLLAGPATSSAYAAKSSNVVLPADEVERRLIVDPVLDVSDSLPSQVFVADNRLEETATVAASGMVVALRLIVVDSKDEIVGLWSNTAGSDSSFYILRVEEGHRTGLEHPLTHAILNQYNQLLNDLDWTIMGRVYYENG